MDPDREAGNKGLASLGEWWMLGAVDDARLPPDELVAALWDAIASQLELTELRWEIGFGNELGFDDLIDGVVEKGKIMETVLHVAVGGVLQNGRGSGGCQCFPAACAEAGVVGRGKGLRFVCGKNEQ